MSSMHELIDSCFDENIDLDITPNEITSVIYSLRKIYQATQEELSIFTDCLRADIFCNRGVISDLEGVFDRGCSVKILIQNPSMIDRETEIFKLIQDNRSRLNYIENSNPEILKCDSNFTISDNKRFRLSKKMSGLHKLSGRFSSSLMSIVNANDTTTTTKLNQTFARLWNVSNIRQSRNAPQ